MTGTCKDPLWPSGVRTQEAREAVVWTLDPGASPPPGLFGPLGPGGPETSGSLPGQEAFLCLGCAVGLGSEGSNVDPLTRHRVQIPAHLSSAGWLWPRYFSESLSFPVCKMRMVMFLSASAVVRRKCDGACKGLHSAGYVAVRAPPCRSLSSQKGLCGPLHSLNLSFSSL